MTTGINVAVMPMTEAMERSNSPTARVTSAAMARNTSVCCDPKIDVMAPTEPNLVGISTR
ncbi:hypothetical protein ACR6C2_38925 [Streptomyces sp. INA 01156]